MKRVIPGRPDLRRMRPRLAAMLFSLAAVAIAGGATAFSTPPDRYAPMVRAVGAIGLTVSDAERSAEFFARVLQFERVAEREAAGPEVERLAGIFGARLRVIVMRLGDETIELTEYLAPVGRPLPDDARSNDRWFQHIAIIVSDMDRAYARLREHGVMHASSGPQLLPDWNTNAGGIRAFYFKDPDGHPLEILQFPEGKGDPKWRRHDGRLFLGIDHTAIVVADTAASLRLYRDAFGMTVAGESENHGDEQEHLNGVFAARLHITSLRAPAGPGIEFLEYIAPSDGRPAPVDLRANDLMHWQTRLVTDDPAIAGAALRAAGGRWVSPGAQRLPGGALDVRTGLLGRDPDGHGLLLVDAAGEGSR